MPLSAALLGEQAAQKFGNHFLDGFPLPRRVDFQLRVVVGGQLEIHALNAPAGIV